MLGSWAAVFVSMLLMFLIFLLHLGLRRDWLAAVCAGLIYAAVSVNWTAPAVDLPYYAAIFCIFLFIVLRSGWLGLAAALVSSAWLDGLTPLTVDPSRWYFGYSLTALLLVAALGLWAFRAALGGRKLLREESLA